MSARRRTYSSSPWTVEAQKRVRYFHRRRFWEGLLQDLFLLFLGASAMLFIVWRVPLPWW